MNRGGPLAGIRVVELIGLAPGPFGAMLLADLGADVVRIDRPQGAITAPSGPLDRGKRKVELDVKDADDLQTLLALVRSADVLIDPYRPGVTERLGLGPEALLSANPRLVYARITGWGQDGPLAPRAGHDINYLALAGALSMVGRAESPPVPPAALLGDMAGGGLLMAFGILAALVERQASGRGQVVDAAIVDGVSLLTSLFHGLHHDGTWGDERGSNLLDGGSIYDTFETSDGKYVAVGALEPQFFAILEAILEIEVDDDFPAYIDPRGWPRWRALLADKFKERTRAEWAAAFEDTDACVTPVLTPWEAPTHRHHRARESFVEVDGLAQPAPAPRFDRTPCGTPHGLEPVAATQVLASWADDPMAHNGPAA
ncbi:MULTISPECIES: CaiB/BaiF CoA transferase family protein [unclassified Nocardioides]|uniref:CaiB/BaiF CoA transferase family protein n=1 Tax=unclassified Nocardioides TaxID=2615069 RepID=UPI0006F42FDD|nr:MULTISPECIES: CaiB/BaiF CoA-transferase family protein [unclassified Nocardioides]KRA28009.1 carnitine dehydratase [Nocardioides sp. Root614]KRA85984.1 carnitine dehydratase [Nocardioides sp. Root682]